MAPSKNLRLLFISCYLLISIHLALSDSDLSPEVSPSFLSDDDDYPMGPTSSDPISDGPAPSPAADDDDDVPLIYASYAPSISEPPVESISPAFNAPSESPSEAPSATDFISFKVDPKLEKICGSTDHPKLCVATVAPLLHKKTADVPSVLEGTINAGIQFAEHVKSLLKELVEKPSMPHDLASVLKDCKDSFDDVLDNFQNAMKAFPDRDIGTLNSMLSAAITDMGDCEDAIAEVGQDTPVTHYADKLTNMTSNCLAIVSLMH